MLNLTDNLIPGTVSVPSMRAQILEYSASSLAGAMAAALILRGSGVTSVYMDPRQYAAIPLTRCLLTVGITVFTEDKDSGLPEDGLEGVYLGNMTVTPYQMRFTGTWEIVSYSVDDNGDVICDVKPLLNTDYLDIFPVSPDFVYTVDGLVDPITDTFILESINGVVLYDN